jgi:hypothetical protein
MTTSPPTVSGALIDRPGSDEGPAVECLEHGVEGDGQGQQVAVVDSAVVELASEVAEQPWPILAPGYDRCGNVHPSLDDPDSSEAGGDRSGLFPGPLHVDAASLWGCILDSTGGDEPAPGSPDAEALV